MRHYLNALFLILGLFLTSCAGSDVYQGNWKATDADGNKFAIKFEQKNFSIKDDQGKVTKYEYSQNSVKIENSVKTYGMHLSDGRVYNISFPLANDTSKGVITLENNDIIYTISRTSYISYKDIYKLSN